MDTALALLPWLLPPALGAIIGYITNRIAIQMLFRPRTAKHILGIHIPFTPGIISKSRDELARNIGQTVARELLSADAIRAQLDRPQLRASLQQWVRQQRETLMQQPISLPDDGHKLLDGLMPVFTESVRRVLRHPAVRDQMIKVGKAATQDWIEEQNSVVRITIRTSRVDRIAADKIPEVVDKIIASAESSATPTRMAELARTWVQTGESKRLGDFVALSTPTEDMIDSFLSERVIAFVGTQISALSDMLDVEHLVTERINAFDAAQVERMVLDVTGHHLKWINYFGAILGFVIGLFPVAVQILP
jgi:uncharacterized membrane protein YheB (UPF0754 family)